MLVLRGDKDSISRYTHRGASVQRTIVLVQYQNKQTPNIMAGEDLFLSKLRPCLIAIGQWILIET